MTNNPHILEKTTVKSMPAIRNLARKEIALPNYIGWYGLTGLCCDVAASQIVERFNLIFTAILLVVGLIGQEVLRWIVYTAVSTEEVKERQEPIQKEVKQLTINAKNETRQIDAVRPSIELPNGVVLTGAQMDILDNEAANNKLISGERLYAIPEFWQGVKENKKLYYPKIRDGLALAGIVEKVGTNYRFTNE